MCTSCSTHESCPHTSLTQRTVLVFSLHEMMHWPSPSAVGAGLLLLLSAGGAGAGMLTYEFRSPSSSRGGRVSVVFLPPNSPSLAVGGGARRVTAT
mmetsp:Transcript_22553/g.64114  ORF Transcript_22553/g.64114 Transcript_22553/m.64114 type:complete len:96 (-) Transcript_22553:802-1089(-)